MGSGLLTSRGELYFFLYECIIYSRQEIKYGFNTLISTNLRTVVLVIFSGEKWHQRHRLLAPAFHFTILKTFFDTIVKNSKLLVLELESEISASQFDITPYLKECSLHNICGE